jgi:glutathione reductase (NADPH)
MSYQNDLFVIGAGSGGVRAARMSATFGAKVAVAEDRYYGGTCVNVGCVPKKLFVYASHFPEDFDTAKGFGWTIDNVRLDWHKLLTNKNKEIERLNGVYKRILDGAGVEIIDGHAMIVDEHTISINGENITAERILIATGGWPSVPDFPGREHVITSNEAFFLDKLPKQIIIVGGGYIAVEFAGIFHGLGVDTTLVYRGPLFLRGFDYDLREILADEMQKKGIKLLFDTNIDRIEKNGNKHTAHLANHQSLITDLIMYATGRTPNTKNLGLENVNVKLNKNGAVIVNEKYQTSVPSIYAIGDVTDRVNLTPVALAEGMILARHLFDKKNDAVDYSDIPTCVFSQPNLGTVGLTEEQAREKYGDVAVYKSKFKPMKLSLTDSDERTFMKLIVDKKSDRVVGVHMLGPDAGEIIQGIAIALKAGATKKTFDSTIGIHPTAAEEFVTMRTPADN